ncbi:MAG: transposase [Flavobacteriales bacterium]|nr:transposase [Flavobacteriales bacterium]
MALLDEAGALLAQERISNEPKAVRALLRRWGKEFRLDKSSMLVCLEPTGHYGYRLVEELVHLASPTWLAHPLDIKHGIGNTRGKSDSIDALRIADYARRYQDKARLVGAEALRMNKLRQLLSCRRQLVTERRRQQVRIKDTNRHMDRSLQSLFDRMSRQRIKQG